MELSNILCHFLKAAEDQMWNIIKMGEKYLIAHINKKKTLQIKCCSKDILTLTVASHTHAKKMPRFYFSS